MESSGRAIGLQSNSRDEEFSMVKSPPFTGSFQVPSWCRFWQGSSRLCEAVTGYLHSLAFRTEANLSKL